MKDQSTVTLSELLEHYRATIWDTCAIQCYIADSLRSRQDYDFIAKLTYQIRRGRDCILPKDIIKELRLPEATSKQEEFRKELIYESYTLHKKLRFHYNEKIASRLAPEDSKKYAWYRISKPDLMVFEHAKIFAEKGIPTAIISNDSGLQYVWEDYISDNKEDINNTQFGFFLRKGGNTFGPPYQQRKY
jgi:hypothetical protein